MDFKAWFDSWGEHKIGHAFTVEDLYQAFVARVTAPPPQNQQAQETAAGQSGDASNA